MSPSNIAFYRTRASANTEQAPLEGGYRSEWWRPTLLNVAPRGLPLVPFGVWWVMHVFQVFSNHGYGILLIRKNGEVVHRSVIFPKYFRFPFMADDDLQIGDVWTSENHRGKGLAGFALREALRKEPQQGRTYWYITEDTNVASVRVAEKAGFERVGEGVRTARFGLRPLGAFVMLREPARKQEPNGMMKKVFDLVLASVGLLALSPLLIAVAVAIKLSSPGPIFYRGERAGLDGRLFHIFKFRTMMVDAERRGPTSTPEDDPRVTPVGRYLRRHKLDELPQLVNVVAGDISLVGPRPQFKWAVDLYNDDERQLLTVRPGITDYASVRFRNEGEILRGSADPDRDYLQKIHPEKVRLGLEYVRRRSLWIDFRLILATLWSMAGGNPERVIKIPSGCEGRDHRV